MKCSRKILGRLAVLLLLHYVGIRLAAHYRVVELVLAQQGSSGVALWGALCFLLIRFALFFAGSGLLLWGTWLVWRESRQETLRGDQDRL